jgi:hypothetical protein
MYLVNKIARERISVFKNKVMQKKTNKYHIDRTRKLVWQIREEIPHDTKKIIYMC